LEEVRNESASFEIDMDAQRAGLAKIRFVRAKKPKNTAEAWPGRCRRVKPGQPTWLPVGNLLRNHHSRRNEVEFYARKR
jgi:hypothetical protein